MKKFSKGKWSIVLFIMLLFWVAACSNEETGSSNGSEKGGSDSEDKIVLGLAAIDLSNPFFVQMKEAGDQAAKDYGVVTEWQSADGSVEKQVSIIENYIQQKVDVILIDPLDKNAVKPVIEEAKEAGIKVITMGNKVEGDWNYNTLYPDYENMAMVARVIGTALDGEGQVALLSGAKGNFVSDTREAGFMETMEKEFPNIEVVGNQPTNFDPAEAQRITDTWLNNYPELDAIAFISDPLGLAAITAAEAKGKKLIYGGYDGDPTMEPYLTNGSMLVDTLTGAFRVGYWNVAAAARLAKGVEFPQDLFMPTYFVTTDKTAEMLANKGLKLDYITPEEAKNIVTGYSEELGPDVPDERISGE
nr:sugar ABC transporter substrate-binding protein [Fredinandcohnia onubensis]